MKNSPEIFLGHLHVLKEPWRWRVLLGNQQDHGVGVLPAALGTETL